MSPLTYPLQTIPLPVPIPADHYLIQTSPLAGAAYHADDEILRELQPGAPLTLIAEPANPHDRYAVRVQCGQHHLGYLPRKSNHIVSRLLQQACPLTAQVAWTSPDSDPPMSLHVLLKKD